MVLSVTFGNQVHYRKETLTIEVVDFEGPYHAIFRRPCYAKFMVVPNYAYLKLKMPGLCGVITITGNFRDAYECEREAVDQADYALNPEEARLNFEIKHRMSSGTTQCAFSSQGHQTMLITPTGISPTLLLLSALSTTPMSEEEPEEA
jgi:hypothetical protein